MWPQSADMLAALKASCRPSVFPLGNRQVLFEATLCTAGLIDRVWSAAAARYRRIRMAVILFSRPISRRSGQSTKPPLSAIENQGVRYSPAVRAAAAKSV